MSPREKVRRQIGHRWTVLAPDWSTISLLPGDPGAPTTPPAWPSVDAPGDVLRDAAATAAVWSRSAGEVACRLPVTWRRVTCSARAPYDLNDAAQTGQAKLSDEVVDEAVVGDHAAALW